MLAGKSPSLAPPRSPSLLSRSRKVKCNRLPGQEKVRLYAPMSSATHPFHLHSARSVQSPVTPLGPSHLPLALSVQKLPLHVGASSLPPLAFPPLISPRSHYVQQATSEKKRNAAARRPRGISTSSRYVFPLSCPRSLAAVVLLVPVLTCASGLGSSSPVSSG